MSDVEDALAVQAESELIDATPAVQTRVGGRPASHLTLSVPEDVDLSDCDGSGETEFRFWDGPGENGEGAVWWIPARAAPGLIGEIYIVDVDGQRVGIQTVHFSDAPAGTGEELQQIVDSIVFEPQGL